MNRCDICLEEECRTRGMEPGSCNCDTCVNIAKCTKVLRPTIRITTKCTQKCDHCCFSCSPTKKKMMTVSTAIKLNTFLFSNKIDIISLMGGEFICNPDWKEIFDILVPGKKYVRLVTNGDWGDHDEVAKFLSKFSNLKVSVSFDRWHTNAHVYHAEKAMILQGIKYNIATEEDVKEDSVVPVGNAELSGSFGFYSSFGTYCSNPDHKYAFLIDEDGKIYKCGFGVWDYAHIDDHIDGSFRARFKEFGMKCEKIFISNCASCYRSYSHSKVKGEW